MALILPKLAVLTNPSLQLSRTDLPRTIVEELADEELESLDQYVNEYHWQIDYRGDLEFKINWHTLTF
jgi:hypothetical protein